MRLLTLALSGGLCVPSGAQYEPDTLKPLPLVTDVFVMPGGQLEGMYAIGLDHWRGGDRPFAGIGGHCVPRGCADV